jgi:hypothetical protein
MAYLTAANLTEGTALFPDVAFKPSEATSTRLTTEIASQSAAFDRLTKSRFETTSAASAEYYGSGTSLLRTYDHPNLQSVTSVAWTAVGGDTGTVDSTSYRVRKFGLEMVGSEWHEDLKYTLTTVSYGLTSCPADVQRAVALMVLFAIKGTNIGHHRAVRWQIGDVVYEAPENSETGIPEVDRIVDRYCAKTPVRFA